MNEPVEPVGVPHMPSLEDFGAELAQTVKDRGYKAVIVLDGPEGAHVTMVGYAPVDTQDASG